MEKQGLTVRIFQAKDFPNCSANGISSMYKELILVPNDLFPDIPKIFGSKDENKLVHIVGRNIGGKIYYHAESLIKLKENVGKNGPMFGGQFIYCSDSRFPLPYPIALHDRYESTF